MRYQKITVYFAQVSFYFHDLHDANLCVCNGITIRISNFCSFSFPVVLCSNVPVYTCVTDKSAKSKKRDGGTPDKMSSPVGSAVHIQDELCTGPPVGKVITGDDIDSLAINVDELKKVSVHAVKANL